MKWNLKCGTSVVAERPETRQHLFYFLRFFVSRIVGVAMAMARSASTQRGGYKRPRACCSHGAVPPCKGGTVAAATLQRIGPATAGRHRAGYSRLRRLVCHRSEPDWHFQEKPIPPLACAHRWTHCLNALIRRVPSRSQRPRLQRRPRVQLPFSAVVARLCQTPALGRSIGVSQKRPTNLIASPLMRRRRTRMRCGAKPWRWRRSWRSRWGWCRCRSRTRCYCGGRCWARCSCRSGSRRWRWLGL